MATTRPTWFYSDNYGFRIVDRSWPINTTSIRQRGVCWVVNPATWTVAPANTTEMTRVYGFKIVGGSQPPNILTEEYERLRIEYRKLRTQLRTEAKKAAHRAHLEEMGIFPTTTVTIDDSGPRRTTGCWRCKSILDSNDDLACAICKWLLCECGACGCGYGIKTAEL